jgi:ATP-dependent helicase/nuclease subunit A
MGSKRQSDQTGAEMKRDDATENQVRAADPTKSTWLSANAGSGKTRVLTDRVARLLLSGVLPEQILCLTYTKAAASEMQNRLFARLGAWAMLDDAQLAHTLQQLGAPETASLAQARRLFAGAIEAPGGLRIQTIHSFCAALLRRFPLEAGVSPQFTEIEDRAAERLRSDILDAMARDHDGQHLAAVARYMTDLTFEKLAKHVAWARGNFRLIPKADLCKAYGLTETQTLSDLVSEVFAPGTMPALFALADIMAEGTKTDVKQSTQLMQLTADLVGVFTLEKMLLHGPTTTTADPFSAKIGKFPTKGTQKKIPDLMPEIDALMTRVEAVRDRRLGLAAVERDCALQGFAQAFLPRYAAEKARRGWLDFDDLITGVNGLLNNPDVAQWVLYRLDGAIDHILVDEAQDTGPLQWEVIARLAQEFMAGEGARSDRARTIFVVGDKKQSIYSFQGADAEKFDQMRSDFAARLSVAALGLQQMSLAFSFRSASPVLAAVDATFQGQEASGFDGEAHRAFKTALPGRVDLWPPVEVAPKHEPADWRAPVDHVSPAHHDVRLAVRIAKTIHRLISEGHPLPCDGPTLGTVSSRPIQAGDFLILVRRRSGIFHQIIQACKALGLPIAGADRLKVMNELAVKDIVALLSFLDTPEDDLSLAAALRSPLFGLDEQDLFSLAHDRPNDAYLWQSLRSARDRHPHVLAILDDLRGQIDFLRPHDLIERLLTRHQGRARLVGRLGAEVEDGIDALLGQALVYERTEVPSLTSFLQWIQSDALEIKRDVASGEGKIRVMTVHGAKGLEAPVVILPDCAQLKSNAVGPLMLDDTGMMWSTRTEDRPLRQRTSAARLAQAEAAERDRLLYVAMTRAETWLIVAAVDRLSKTGDDWYSQVRTGLLQSGANTQDFDFGSGDLGQGLRLESDWPHIAENVGKPAASNLAVVLPPDQPVAHENHPRMRTPSDLGGAKALPGQGDLAAIAQVRGRDLHSLLEVLPQVPEQDWSAVAQILVSDDADHAALLKDADRILKDSNLAKIFALGTLCEVPVTGDVPGLGRMHGVIDRLIVSERDVTVVDFKSNRVVPNTPTACPEGLLRQMGAYYVLVSKLYPGRCINTVILWTQTGALMPLPSDLVTSALRRAELDVSSLRA